MEVFKWSYSMTSKFTIFFNHYMILMEYSKYEYYKYIFHITLTQYQYKI